MIYSFHRKQQSHVWPTEVQPGWPAGKNLAGDFSQTDVLVSLLPFAELCSERHGVHVQKVNRSGPTGFSWT